MLGSHIPSFLVQAQWRASRFVIADAVGVFEPARYESMLGPRGLQALDLDGDTSSDHADLRRPSEHQIVRHLVADAIAAAHAGVGTAPGSLTVPLV